jgi:hypothetical protein
MAQIYRQKELVASLLLFSTLEAPVPHIIKQNTYSTSSTVKVDAVTETNLNTMPTCVSLRRNECIVVAGVQIQYKDMYSTKNSVGYGTGFVHCLSRGNGPYAPTHPRTDRICSLLSPSKHTMMPRWVSQAAPFSFGSNNQPSCIVFSPVVSSTVF